MDLEFLQAVVQFDTGLLLRNLPFSHAQLRQDLFVLAVLGFPKAGYFVEFGAADGIRFSNTYLLEKQFGWTGVLAEPAKVWSQALRTNRSCHIDSRCVWSESGKHMSFLEAPEAELSTLEEFKSVDGHSDTRESGRVYSVETISLEDLLDHYSAPKVIDYLSIDTEGSELPILESLDFNKYQFKVITCEHNLTPAREDIRQLLESRGYRRVFTEVSRWDDWYVMSQIPRAHAR